MKNLMNLIILSCKKATLLVEKREVKPLSFFEKIQLTMHTSMCDACRAYEKQSQTINKAISQWFDATKNKEPLSYKVKERIIEEIKSS
jgi:hypothetical protein